MADEPWRIRQIKRRWDEEDRVRDELERQARLAFLERAAGTAIPERCTISAGGEGKALRLRSHDLHAGARQEL
jgi:hypothetical protein